ncbi:hypothetical protein GCM10023187_11450 [Nibrella viscosa]|uniref:CehA/McbA family metallohydrolase n=1 Tax=Nibrella viscosa TaxID=1084524 RepID=A0ABP8K2G7_9BACT
MAVIIADAGTGKPTPVRVRLTQASRPVPALPPEAAAVMYGLWDHADGYGFQPDSAVYVPGTFTLSLPPGRYELTLSKGPEYLDQRHELVIQAGKTLKKSYKMARWINTADRGWYSADGHIHIRRSPREDPLLMHWLQAEDLRVGVLLRMGDFWETYYPQYAWGEKGVYQSGNYLLTSGQEDPRTPEVGHAVGIGASDRVRYRDEYYLYDKVFDQLHKLGGVTGYAHQAESFHGYRGLVLDGLRGKVDMLELLQFCVSEQPLRTDHYYHMLDIGIPLTATAGSDFPWCGHDHETGPPERTARIGNARFYTYLNGPFSYRNWKAGLAAGHTFVSSGPVLELKVNTAIPGDRLNVKAGENMTITAHAYGHAVQVPLEALEIVSHGKVIARVTKGQTGQSSEHLTLTLDQRNLQRGMWVAARCIAGPQQAAHTTPVYVTVDGGGFHNPETAGHYLTLSEQYLTELEQELDKDRQKPEFQAWYYRKALKTRIDETRKVIDDLRKKLK